MNQIKLFSAFSLLAGMFFFTSCNDEGKKTETTTTGSDSTAAPVASPAPKPGYLLIIRHKVASYDKWLPAYESHDSVRQAYGIHNFLVARGTKDSNTVMVVLRTDDTTKARQFGEMPSLKEAMKKGGVVGAPTMLMLDVQMQDTSSNASPSRVIITHKVKDWDAWKKSFDSHKQTRMDAGLTDRAVSYSVGDNHNVTVAFLISDMQKAEAFMQSKDLKDKMAEAGVVGQPDVFFYTVTKKY